jgi:hypothetical protein
LYTPIYTIYDSNSEEFKRSKFTSRAKEKKLTISKSFQSIFGGDFEFRYTRVRFVTVKFLCGVKVLSFGFNGGPITWCCQLLDPC